MKNCNEKCIFVGDILPGIFNLYDSTFDDLKNHTKKIVDGLTLKQNDEIIWQKYYQWVCIIFGLQALLFYLPRYIWKYWEGGRMELLVQDLCKTFHNHTL